MILLWGRALTSDLQLNLLQGHHYLLQHSFHLVHSILEGVVLDLGIHRAHHGIPLVLGVVGHRRCHNRCGALWLSSLGLAFRLGLLVVLLGLDGRRSLIGFHLLDVHLGELDELHVRWLG